MLVSIIELLSNKLFFGRLRIMIIKFKKSNLTKYLAKKVVTCYDCRNLTMVTYGLGDGNYAIIIKEITYLIDLQRGEEYRFDIQNQHGIISQFHLT
jgi:hypothetical protein